MNKNVLQEGWSLYWRGAQHSTIPSVDSHLIPALGKGQTDLYEFQAKPSKKQSNKKPRSLCSPMLSFPLNDIHSRPQAHKFTSPRQHHHFADDGQGLTGIPPRFCSGC